MFMYNCEYYTANIARIMLIYVHIHKHTHRRVHDMVIHVWYHHNYWIWPDLNTIPMLKSRVRLYMYLILQVINQVLLAEHGGVKHGQQPGVLHGEHKQTRSERLCRAVHLLGPLAVDLTVLQLQGGVQTLHHLTYM